MGEEETNNNWGEGGGIKERAAGRSGKPFSSGLFDWKDSIVGKKDLRLIPFFRYSGTAGDIEGRKKANLGLLAGWGKLPNAQSWTISRSLDRRVFS